MESNNGMDDRKTKIITIDGPAGAGKSTVAKKLAKALQLSYLDTGAMYRALTLKALGESINLDDEHKLVALAQDTQIDLEDALDGVRVLVDGVDVSERIRSVEVTNNTSKVASIPGVREIMVRWQREIGHKRSVVIEGRDTGTIVFPDATYKFYMDADLIERARRRVLELKEKGTVVDEEMLIKQIRERDNMDMYREAGPLKKAEDAIVIDSTNLSIDETVVQMLQIVNKDG